MCVFQLKLCWVTFAAESLTFCECVRSKIGSSNAVSCKLLADAGATSINPPTDLTVPQIAVRDYFIAIVQRKIVCRRLSSLLICRPFAKPLITHWTCMWRSVSDFTYAIWFHRSQAMLSKFFYCRCFNLGT